MSRIFLCLPDRNSQNRPLDLRARLHGHDHRSPGATRSDKNFGGSPSRNSLQDCERGLVRNCLGCWNVLWQRYGVYNPGSMWVVHWGACLNAGIAQVLLQSSLDEDSGDEGHDSGDSIEDRVHMG